MSSASICLINVGAIICQGMFDYSKDTAVEDTGVINYFFVQALDLSASSMN